MAPASAIESLSPTEQVVLLGVAELERADETPAQTHDLRRVCTRRLSGLETQVVGTLTEADVMRSLYRLEDEEIVAESRPDESSPVGKGRLAYSLVLDVEAVYESGDDELVGERES